MKSIHFFNEDVVFNKKNSNLTEKQIIDIIPYPFNGKNDFMQFYSIANGGFFPNGAFYYRDAFYPTSMNDYNLMDVGSFLSIANSENSLSSLWNSLKENIRVKEFASVHLPFAVDASGNFFWIEFHSGLIKYINMEDPNEITLIAPSFIDFCKGIQANPR